MEQYLYIEKMENTKYDGMIDERLAFMDWMFLVYLLDQVVLE